MIFPSLSARIIPSVADCTTERNFISDSRRAVSDRLRSVTSATTTMIALMVVGRRSRYAYMDRRPILSLSAGLEPRQHIATPRSIESRMKRVLFVQRDDG